MRILFATYASGSDFLKALKYNRRKDESTLAVHTKARYRAGQALIVEVGFPGLPSRVLLRVKATETKGRFPGQRFIVDPAEKERCGFLRDTAAGASEGTHRRQHRRFPIEIPARFFVDEEGSFLRGDAVTRDVAARGVALNTYRLLPDGARVTVILDFIGDVTLEFQGRVSWTKRENGQACVGIQFDKVNNDQMKRLRWILREVKISGRTFEGTAIHDPLAPEPPAPGPIPAVTLAPEQPAPGIPAVTLPPMAPPVSTEDEGARIRAVGTPSAGNRLPTALQEDSSPTEVPTARPGLAAMGPSAGAPMHLDDEDADTFQEGL